MRSGRSFRYLRPDGRSLLDPAQLARIQSLAIPPAWRDVWICPHRNGHLQATGVDARGRKQYRYHADWTVARNEVKFDAMIDFAYALPAIRRRVRRDLHRKGMPKDKAVACIVRLMDQSLIRVGNDEYARSNDSFGLTTMRNHHVKVNGSTIRFSFKGKSGQRIETTIEDPRAARIIRKCQDLPGQEVFSYIDERGHHRDVGSGHVNEYLYEVTKKRFTAKDFRTWGGTVVAAEALYECGPCAELRKRAGRNGPTKGKFSAVSDRELKRRCNEAVKKAAEALGNRVATCRKFYVHPKLADCYADGRLEKAFLGVQRNPKPRELSREERALLRLLQMTH